MGQEEVEGALTAHSQQKRRGHTEPGIYLDVQ